MTDAMTHRGCQVTELGTVIIPMSIPTLAPCMNDMAIIRMEQIMQQFHITFSHHRHKALKAPHKHPV